MFTHVLSLVWHLWFRGFPACFSLSLGKCNDHSFWSSNVNKYMDFQSTNDVWSVVLTMQLLFGKQMLLRSHYWWAALGFSIYWSSIVQFMCPFVSPVKPGGCHWPLTCLWMAFQWFWLKWDNKQMVHNLWPQKCSLPMFGFVCRAPLCWRSRAMQVFWSDSNLICDARCKSACD